jgi:hypothetical protein
MLNVKDFNSPQEVAAYVKVEGIVQADIQGIVWDDNHLRWFLWWWTP